MGLYRQLEPASRDYLWLQPALCPLIRDGDDVSCIPSGPTVALTATSSAQINFGTRNRNVVDLKVTVVLTRISQVSSPLCPKNRLELVFRRLPNG